VAGRHRSEISPAPSPYPALSGTMKTQERKRRSVLLVGLAFVLAAPIAAVSELGAEERAEVWKPMVAGFFLAFATAAALMHRARRRQRGFGRRHGKGRSAAAEASGAIGAVVGVVLMLSLGDYALLAFLSVGGGAVTAILMLAWNDP
jgi:hypothetical protein